MSSTARAAEVIAQVRDAALQAAGVPTPTRGPLPGGTHRVLCPEPDCVDGKVVLNPAWPSGTEPYCENCSTCGGSGEVDPSDLPCPPSVDTCPQDV